MIVTHERISYKGTNAERLAITVVRDNACFFETDTLSEYIYTGGAWVAKSGPAGPAAPHNILSATHSDTLAAAIVRGDILVGNSTPKLARLAKGTANAVLTGDGNDTAWSTYFITGTAAQTYAFPAVGGTVALLNAANVFTAKQTISMAAGPQFRLTDTTLGAYCDFNVDDNNVLYISTGANYRAAMSAGVWFGYDWPVYGLDVPSFANINDSNTGLGFIAADTLSLFTGGAHRLNISATQIDFNLPINVVTFEDEVVCLDGDVVLLIV